MTTYGRAKRTCPVCNKTIFFMVCSSHYYSGRESIQLDLHMPEDPMAGRWIRACMCGYCSPDLGIVGDLAEIRAVMSGEAYQNFMADPSVFSGSKKFLCYALLALNRQDYFNAGWAYLHAARVCDDRLHYQPVDQDKWSSFERIGDIIIVPKDYPKEERPLFQRIEDYRTSSYWGKCDFTGTPFWIHPDLLPIDRKILPRQAVEYRKVAADYLLKAIQNGRGLWSNQQELVNDLESELLSGGKRTKKFIREFRLLHEVLLLISHGVHLGKPPQNVLLQEASRIVSRIARGKFWASDDLKCKAKQTLMSWSNDASEGNYFRDLMWHEDLIIIDLLRRSRQFKKAREYILGCDRGQQPPPPLARQIMAFQMSLVQSRDILEHQLSELNSVGL